MLASGAAYAAFTYYVGNHIYNKENTEGASEKLTLFNTAEGYIEPELDEYPGGYSIEGFDYVYQYKDHLGNIRLAYQDVNHDGSIDNTTEIKEENHYYPFGLKHQGYNNQITGKDHPYGFGAKEEQSELDLEWLNFGARNYDASLGRWMNIDPMADSYRSFSPYNYATNSPNIFVDLDGRDISFSFVYERDEKGNLVINENGNANLISVTMTVTGKVMNSTNRDINMNDAIEEISNQITSSFQGTSSEGIEFNTIVKLTEAKSMKDVEDDDHLFVLDSFDEDGVQRNFGVDRKTGRNKATVVAGVNQYGGKVVFVDYRYFTGVIDTTIGWEGERSVAHEFGHLLNLGHTSRFLNLMVQGGWGTGISKAQLSTIINTARYEKNRINRGKNYEIVSQKNHFGKGFRKEKKPNRGQLTPLINYRNW